MTEQHVVTEIEGPIAHVWLNRPDKLNGITFDVLDGLLEAADRIESDPNVRAVLLEGRGPSFCAGLDFGQVMTDKKRVARYFLPNPLKGTNTLPAAAVGVARAAPSRSSPSPAATCSAAASSSHWRRTSASRRRTASGRSSRPSGAWSPT